MGIITDRDTRNQKSSIIATCTQSSTLIIIYALLYTQFFFIIDHRDTNDNK